MVNIKINTKKTIRLVCVCIFIYIIGMGDCQIGCITAIPVGPTSQSLCMSIIPLYKSSKSSKKLVFY